MSKTYSKEEREQALKIAAEIRVTAAGRQLGINPNAISNWKNRKPKALKEIEWLSEEEKDGEILRLKKKLAEKVEEVEILQAALGFFVKGRRK